jgi:hypothetical protein
VTTAEVRTCDEALSHITPGDRRRAAAILASAVQGDRWGLTAGIAEAQLADRVGCLVSAATALLVDAVPELKSTDVVDRLRSLAAPAMPTVVRDQAKPPKRRQRKPMVVSVTQQYDAWLRSLSG